MTKFFLGTFLLFCLLLAGYSHSSTQADESSSSPRFASIVDHGAVGADILLTHVPSPFHRAGHHLAASLAEVTDQQDDHGGGCSRKKPMALLQILQSVSSALCLLKADAVWPMVSAPHLPPGLRQHLLFRVFRI